jgi:hypothetical protein
MPKYLVATNVLEIVHASCAAELVEIEETLRILQGVGTLKIY